MTPPENAPLRLRAGDWVEVRSSEEILATLDERGRLDGLPFMPEMLAFCGRRLRVYKSAHKTCDTIESYRSRGMRDAVHLEGSRCDGSAHGGCQAACLLFWKTAWLRRAPGPAESSLPAGTVAPAAGASPASSRPNPAGAGPSVRIDLDGLARARRAEVPGGEPEAAGRSEDSIAARDADGRPADASDATIYSCQATELRRATFPLSPRDPRHYWQDLASRNVGLGGFLLGLAVAAYNLLVRMHGSSRTYPHIRGLAGEKTPAETLNLQPGELVRVRSKREIMGTINRRQRNRGLWFDAEMVPYCGRTFRVLARVDRIIDERTGAMIHLPTTCIILDGVVCGGRLSQGRLFCPRSIYPFWHEIWLRRAEPETERPPRPPEDA